MLLNEKGILPNPEEEKMEYIVNKEEQPSYPSFIPVNMNKYNMLNMNIIEKRIDIKNM